VDTLKRTLADPVTYRRLAYLLLGAPLGLIWFVCLVTVWSLCLGLAITPLVIPVLVALAFMTRGFAAVEAELASALLGLDARVPDISIQGRRLSARLRHLFGGGFWRAQAFLWIRSSAGFAAGLLMLTLLGTSVSLILGPLWKPLVPGGTDIGFLTAHPFLRSLALVPVGLALLPLTIALARPLGGMFRPIAAACLHQGTSGPESLDPGAGSARPGVVAAGPTRAGVTAHAVVGGSIVATLTVIWAATGLGYYWPIWIMLLVATTLAIHAWLVRLDEHPELIVSFRGSRSLAVTAGVGASFWLFTVGVWAVSGHGYFWPIWTLLGFALIVGALVAAMLLGPGHDAEMAQRIETLTATRAGAVNAQDSELRRIERDLHDGAQARLVALGMNLGMAEQKLADDPERAGELLAEARAGAEQALRELRDLARGIHPPVLADRGLEAAVGALANATPMHVALSVDMPRRPPAAIESAAYFVAAESLANAAKHARAEWLEIRIAEVGNRLELEISDDGVGGANPDGSGLIGLRRRVEALDGTLEVTSPPGGPTTIYAEIPCAW
jgi:signal transduction histidine kinase